VIRSDAMTCPGMAGLALLLALAVGRPAQADETAEVVDARPVFEQATAYVRRDAAALGATFGVHLDLEDVTVKGAESGSHDGNSRVWLQIPDRFRLETRTLRNTPLAMRTVKLLDGDRAWIYHPPAGPEGRGRWERLHGTPDGVATIAQLKADRDLFVRLCGYVTFAGLAGQGARFEDQGLVTFPQDHHLAGTWWKVRRQGPKGDRMAFLFDYDDEAGRRSVRAPHAVLVPGDAAAGRAAEHIVLSGWRVLHDRLVPAKVLRWTQQEGGGFLLTLRARVKELAFAAHLEQGVFADPTAGPPEKR